MHKPHILVVEPYFGGSHKAFVNGLCRSLPCRFSRLTLPARKWKMRMQLAAPWMAEKTLELIAGGEEYDLVLCTSLLDAAAYRSLLAGSGVHLPLALYFHENQFVYPDRGPGNPYQFTALNFTSALAADRIAFNSRYNRDTFMQGVRRYLKKAVDTDIDHLADRLAAKAEVLYPGMEYPPPLPPQRKTAGRVPTIVWNHRWEHDKDPETFFSVLGNLSRQGAGFRLMVLGKGFARRPGVFNHARRQLAEHIAHFGFVRERNEYFRLLHQADIVVSTARHEFFGMAVMEAVRCGCRPLVPDRLSYPELFPAEYRYGEGGLQKALSGLLQDYRPLEAEEARRLTVRYSWDRVKEGYAAWLTGAVRREDG